MKREIKFRAWDTMSKCYIMPDVGYQGHYILSLKGEFYNLQNGSGGDEYVVQQWTGFKDKNGKDIYEGDVLSYEGIHKVGKGVSVVSFEDGSFMIDEDIASKDWAVEHKVIGNVFETPELLKILKS